MTYQLNLHRHVKVWLSEDRNSFLNPVNQLRLIRQRYLNPQDEIHLAFDSRLLSLEAWRALQQFCENYKIKPINIQNIKPKNTNEKRLLNHYEQEIFNIKQGGNTGAASDLLRWISGIYTLGIYSDFDVEVDTRALPEAISVESPIILDVGSMQDGTQDFVQVNNHVIAIIDSEDAETLVHEVQQGLLDAFENKDYFAHLARILEAEEKQCNIRAKHMLTEIRTQSRALHAMRHNMETVQELRHSLMHVVSQETKDAIQFQMDVIEANKQLPKQLREAMASLIPKWVQEQTKKMDEMKLVELYNHLLKNTQLKSLIFTLLWTSGPGIVGLALLGQLIFSSSEVCQRIKAFALTTYHLREAFKTSNTLPFHTDFAHFLRNGNFGVGECCDISWSEQGAGLLQQRAEMIREEVKGLQLRFAARTELKQAIELHIEKIKWDQKGFFAGYRTAERNAKISALQAALACFNADDTINFKRLHVLSNRLNQEDVFASIGSSTTKRLFDAMSEGSLLKTKRQVLRHIQKIEQDQQGFWGAYRVSERNKKVDALKTLLSCFDKDGSIHFNHFHQFRSVFADAEARRDEVFASFWPSQTQTLFQKVEEKGLKHSLEEIDKLLGLRPFSG